MPYRRLPSLSSLRAFEAAARRLSFKAAAQELAVTPGAISQQIRALEEDLGVALFIRRARAVTLTPAGLSLQPDVTESFLRLRKAVDRVATDRPRSLKINSSAPTIIKFLLPRLHRFTGLHPDLHVSIETEHTVNPMDPDGPDVAIRVTQSPPDWVFSRLLHQELLLPLASPSLIDQLGLQDRTDILRAPLLHDRSLSIFEGAPTWQTWFEAAGMRNVVPTGGVQFEWQSPDYVIDLAIAGNGVMLGRSSLAYGALSAGLLTCPFGPVLRSDVGTYVLARHDRKSEPGVRAFVEWLEAEAALLSTVNALHSTA